MVVICMFVWFARGESAGNGALHVNIIAFICLFQISMPRMSSQEAKSSDDVFTPQIRRNLRSRRGNSSTLQPTLEAALSARQPLREIAASPPFRAARMRARSVSSSESIEQPVRFQIGGSGYSSSKGDSIENTPPSDVRGKATQVAPETPEVVEVATQTLGDFMTRQEMEAMFVSKTEATNSYMTKELEGDIAYKIDLGELASINFVEERLAKTCKVCRANWSSLNGRINEMTQALERKLTGMIEENTERMREVLGADTLGPIIGRALSGGLTEPKTLRKAVTRAFGEDLMLVSRKIELRKLRDIAATAAKSGKTDTYQEAINRLLAAQVDIDAAFDSSLEVSISAELANEKAAKVDLSPETLEITAMLSKIPIADLHKLRLYIEKAKLEVANQVDSSASGLSRQGKRRLKHKLHKIEEARQADKQLGASDLVKEKVGSSQLKEGSSRSTGREEGSSHKRMRDESRSGQTSS